MISKRKICIVIPIYKETLNGFEVQSVAQCLKVLCNYSIYFVAPKGLNIDFYKGNFSSISNFTYFEKHYFADISGYNRLLLSAGFYKAFDNYQYMLLYQTDCYVFRDELLDWANKGFDYIGGIWFENYQGDPFLGAKIWYPGNGGFSLRKIKTIISLLSSRKPIKNIQQLIIEKRKLYKKGKINFIKEAFLLPMNALGYQNNYNYLAKKYSFNEDSYFVEACLRYNVLKMPDVGNAIGFSWDRCPTYLNEIFGNLPFACHAWFRDDFPYEENKGFWSKYIKIK